MSTEPNRTADRRTRVTHDVPSRSSNRQQLLWAILENLSEGVVACDAQGTLSFFNRATRDFHGIPEDAMSSEDWSEHYSLYRADGTPMAEDEVPLFRALRGETVRDAVMVIAPRTRDARTVICTGGPLYDTNGDLLGAVVAMRDVTEQIAAARQKEDLVRERELNEAKDQLLATVSHELRNPLTSIVGWTQLLQHSIESDDARVALAAIAAAAQMQSQLIADLSDVARISAGKLTLQREWKLLHEILDIAVQGVRLPAEAKGIALLVPASYERVLVDVDPVRLQQVFWNLLTNAVKFTPAGGTVTVGMRVKPDTVCVEVRDDGPGISAEFLPRVFDRYAQEKSGRRAHSGLGLGLSIARTIVELHGGSIVASSAGAGTGAAFSVTLPRASSEERLSS
ncbi:MAG TPA: ATP-binding protein [Thermoanaerobaculia bacterium]|nr:ATP-binding protein [Thermoanaerobaculia bacterium]